MISSVFFFFHLVFIYSYCFHKLTFYYFVFFNFFYTSITYFIAVLYVFAILMSNCFCIWFVSIKFHHDCIFHSVLTIYSTFWFSIAVILYSSYLCHCFVISKCMPLTLIAGSTLEFHVNYFSTPGCWPLLLLLLTFFSVPVQLMQLTLM